MPNQPSLQSNLVYPDLQAWNSPTSVGLFPSEDYMLMLPYAYEVTPKRGEPYLVFHGSTAHDNAALFGYSLKPLYEKPV